MIDPVSRNWPENARMLTGRIPLGNITNKKLNDIGATNAFKKATTRELKGFDAPIWKMAENRKLHDNGRITLNRPMVPLVSSSMDTTYDTRSNKISSVLPSVFKSADARLPPLKPSESPALDSASAHHQTNMVAMEVKRHFEKKEAFIGRNLSSANFSNTAAHKHFQQQAMAGTKHHDHDNRILQQGGGFSAATKENQLLGVDFSDVHRKENRSRLQTLKAIYCNNNISIAQNDNKSSHPANATIASHPKNEECSAQSRKHNKILNLQKRVRFAEKLEVTCKTLRVPEEAINEEETPEAPQATGTGDRIFQRRSLNASTAFPSVVKQPENPNPGSTFSRGTIVMLRGNVRYGDSLLPESRKKPYGQKPKDSKRIAHSAEHSIRPKLEREERRRTQSEQCSRNRHPAEPEAMPDEGSCVRKEAVNPMNGTNHHKQLPSRREDLSPRRTRPGIGDLT